MSKKFVLENPSKRPNPLSDVLFEGIKGTSEEKEKARQHFLINQIYQVRKIILDGKKVFLTICDTPGQWDVSMFRLVKYL